MAIAVDMTRLAMLVAMDAAILFSLDKDLLRAIEVLWGLPGVAVEVACWFGARRVRLDGTQRPWCRNLNESDFLRVEDKFDYSAPE